MGIKTNLLYSLDVFKLSEFGYSHSMYGAEIVGFKPDTTNTHKIAYIALNLLLASVSYAKM